MSPTGGRARHRILCALLLFALGGSAGTVAAATPDAARGGALFKRHCVSCHTPGIHARPKQLPMSRDDLRMLIDTFRRQANLGLTRDEIDDIVEYLNRTRYHFPPDKAR